MTRLQNLTRAIPPSYQALCQHHCRTKTSLLTRCKTQIRPQQATSLAYAGYAVVTTGFRSQSTGSRPSSSPAAQPKQDTAYDMIYAVNQPADLPERVNRLSPPWQINAARKSVTRIFTFTSFAKAWRFMSLVADECKVKKHHPSWSNMYNTVSVEWTTHKPEGLSIKDVDMAEFCDRKAAEIGLKEPEV